MNDNFTPNMGTYTNLTPFRFWCQKVLPFTYDNSLSYYELLCKVVDYLNKTMEDVDTAIEDMEKLYDAYDELQEFVTTYFDNLDVQEEVNTKLDEMAEDGSLDALILPYFNAYKAEINETIDEFQTDISEAISEQNSAIDVLEGRMDTFTNLPNGSTSGDAELADIRVGGNGITYDTAGDAVRGQYTENRNNIIGNRNSIYTSMINQDLSFLQTTNGKYCSNINGTLETNSHWGYTSRNESVPRRLHITGNSDYKITIVGYDETLTHPISQASAEELQNAFVSAIYVPSVVMTNDDVILPDSWVWFVINIGTADNSNMTSAKMQDALSNITTYARTDRLLVNEYSAADAYHTGEAIYQADVNLAFTQGGIDSATGVQNSNSTRISTKGLCDDFDYIYADTGYEFAVFGYNYSSESIYGTWDTSTGAFDYGHLHWYSRLSLDEIRGKCDYMRVSARHSDNSNISPTENTYIHFRAKKLNPLYGKKIASLGDSITYGYIPRNTFGYPGQLKSFTDIIAMRAGMDFANYGIIGSTLAYHASRDPMSRRYNDLPNDADFITVMGGTNDVRNGIQLGTINDETDATYYGALKIIFAGLYKKYFIDNANPNVKIIGITPLKLLETSGGVSGGTGTLYNLEPWADAVKEVAKYYSIPVIDAYNLSYINPHLNETIHGTVSGYTDYYNPYITDGTHPTQAGQKMLADLVYAQMKSLT